MRLTLLLFFFTQLVIAQNFEQTQKFVNSDRALNGLFGFNISVSESTMVITAPGMSVDRGAAYIFEKDDVGNWVEIQKLVPNDVQVGDGFGLAGVYLSEDLLIVSSENQDFDENGENELSSAGAVYVFERDDTGLWEEVQKIVASDPEQDAEFGISLDYKNDILIVGADRESEDENGGSSVANAGAAYVFEKQNDNTFLETQKIVPTTRNTGDAFGVLVRISDTFIAISSSQEFASSTGIINVFEQDNTGVFTEVQQLQPEGLDVGDGFGIAAISETYIVAGAIFDSEDENDGNLVPNAGSAFIYERVADGTWNLSEKIVASIREENDLFGSRTAISGNDIIVASLLEDEDENGNNTLINAGSVYVYRDSTLSVEDVSDDVGSIYPNPSHGQFTISFHGNPKSGTITMINTLGQIIVEKGFENMTTVVMKMEGASGLYIVHYKTTDGDLGAIKYIKN